MFSRWMALYGVSRGTRTSFRPSFRQTSAARWIRFVPAPDAIAPIVPIEQGTTIIPACLFEPDEGFAAKLSSRQKRISFESLGRPSQVLIDAVSDSFRSAPISTFATVAAVPEMIRFMVSTAPLAARSCSVRWAYIVPDAPVIATVNSMFCRFILALRTQIQKPGVNE